MINSGWTAAQAEYFYALIRKSHRVIVGVSLMDLKHNVLTNVSHLLISGQVDMDANADITRSAKLSMLDPSNILGFDYPSGGYGQNYYNRMFHITYEIAPLDGSAGPSVIFPLFTGPVTDVDRDGPVYDIECQGKEVLASEGIKHDWSWPTGWAKSSIIANFINDYLGEDFMYIYGVRPDQVISGTWAVEAGENMWQRFKEMADGFNYNLYYDAWGICRLKPMTRAPVFEFNESMMTSHADVSFDIDNLINCVRVTGGTPEGVDGRYIAEAYPAVEHPLSPWSLSRSTRGIPRYLPELISDDSLLSQDDVNAVALNTLSDRMISSLDATFTSMVVPHLEEWDMIQINSSRYWGWARHTKQSIPLVGDAEMSVGFLASSSFAIELGGGVPVVANMSGSWQQEIEANKKSVTANRQKATANTMAKNKARVNAAKATAAGTKKKKVNAGKKKKPKKGASVRGFK